MKNIVKQVYFKWMDDDHNGNNIQISINFNFKRKLF
jgi:hypothetical protein